MKKIIVSNRLSLDGIFSGPNGETDWFTTDAALEAYNLDQLQQSGTILFGRITYQLMLDYWPTAEAARDYPAATEYMNNSAKHIFSKTITDSNWENCFFHKALSKATVESIRDTAPNHTVILGSGELSMQLHQMGLIDEYHILLDPQLLGKGRLFFQDIEQTSLQLLEAKPFGCGVVYLRYRVGK